MNFRVQHAHNGARIEGRLSFSLMCRPIKASGSEIQKSLTEKLDDRAPRVFHLFKKLDDFCSLAAERFGVGGVSVFDSIKRKENRVAVTQQIKQRTIIIVIPILWHFYTRE